MTSKNYNIAQGSAKEYQTLSLDGQNLSISNGNTVELPTELSGHGFPEGKVTGHIGTTYIDLDVTNGAVKWVKTTEGGNTGWKILRGDTGWVKMQTVSVPKGQFIAMRRVNDTVTFKVVGGSFGRLGIVGRGKPGFVPQNYQADRGCRIIIPGQIIQGFRATYSQQGMIFQDDQRNQKVYGSWYVGGTDDSNFMRLIFDEVIPTEPINDIRFSSASWFTDDPYPTGKLDKV